MSTSSDRWILGFDASTPRCVIVLGRIDEHGKAELVVADEDTPEGGGNQASVHLVPRLQAALDTARIRAEELAAIACGCGPGTFTGTRVAVATAKGLSVGLGRPLVPVSTLVAVAFSAERSGWIVPVLDARRGEVYGGLVRCTWEAGPVPPHVTLESEQRCTPLDVLLDEALAAAQGEGVTIVGTAVEPYFDSLPDALQAQAIVLAGPTATGLWGACARSYVDGGERDPAQVSAIYLRKSYAELGVNKPKRAFVRSPFV